LKWFKHDTDASTDAKLKKLILRHGTDGYAIYFHCLELIAGDISESNITFVLEHDSEIIADNLKIKGTPDISAIDLVDNIMLYIIELKLFEESNGRIFCFKLLKRLDKSMTGNAKFRDMIDLSKKSHDSIMIKSDSVMQDYTKQDKTIPDKTKPNNTTLEFKEKICVELLEEWIKNNLPKHKIKTVIDEFKKSHYDIINNFESNYDCLLFDIIKVYSEIVNNPIYYYTHKFSLWNFIKYGYKKFLPEMNPKENFIIDKNNITESDEERLERIEKRKKDIEDL